MNNGRYRQNTFYSDIKLVFNGSRVHFLDSSNFDSKVNLELSETKQTFHPVQQVDMINRYMLIGESIRKFPPSTDLNLEMISEQAINEANDPLFAIFDFPIKQFQAVKCTQLDYDQIPRNVDLKLDDFPTDSRENSKIVLVHFLVQSFDNQLHHFFVLQALHGKIEKVVYCSPVTQTGIFAKQFRSFLFRQTFAFAGFVVIDQDSNLLLYARKSKNFETEKKNNVKINLEWEFPLPDLKIKSIVSQTIDYSLTVIGSDGQVHCLSHHPTDSLICKNHRRINSRIFKHFWTLSGLSDIDLGVANRLSLFYRRSDRKLFFHCGEEICRFDLDQITDKAIIQIQSLQRQFLIEDEDGKIWYMSLIIDQTGIPATVGKLEKVDTGDMENESGMDESPVQRSDPRLGNTRNNISLSFKLMIHPLTFGGIAVGNLSLTVKSNSYRKMKSAHKVE